MTVIDGVVYATPTDDKEKLRAFCNEMNGLFKDYGAVQVVDAWGIEVPDGEVTSFPMAVKAKPDETVCFGWVTWPSAEARAKGWEKLMQDERMSNAAMPFDGKRMIFGTFEAISGL